jgi:uncharacterized protein (DUF3084 family)
MRKQTIMLSALLGCATVFLGEVQAADKLDRAQQTSRDTTREAKTSQRRIDQLSDATHSLLEQYRAQLWKAQQLQLYVRQLNATVKEQEHRKEVLDEQLERLERTRQELVPMLVRMVDGLEQFIALDLPFLPDERKQRVERLRKVLADPEIAVSEQYRRVFEAYQVEAAYGRNLEAWRGPLDASAQIVDYLRIGRMAWYYLSLDGKAAWQWDVGRGLWDPVPSNHVGAIRKGLRVASEQATPELLALPLKGAS